MASAEAAHTPMTDAPSLVAIARAAHQTGDRELERAARRLLRERFGIKITFRRPGNPQELTHAG